MTSSSMIVQTLGDFLALHGDGGRAQLLPALWACQDEFGFISEENARIISQRLRVPLADVYGVIEFYTLFYEEPTAETIIRICDNPACTNKGSRETAARLSGLLDTSLGTPTDDGKFLVEHVPCLGLCEHAPAALVGKTAFSQAVPANAEALVANTHAPANGRLYGDQRPLTQRCGVIDPTSLDDYRAHMGFEGFEAALKLEPETIIELIKAAGLKGRGGAAFPTGIKWEGARNAESEPKYVICNADESEPGTFKDRVLLEEDPFSVLEGMLIAAYAIGANYGYMYIRGEYPNAQRIFKDVLAAARQAGYLGDDIQGTGWAFDIELRSGGGAYICGEETALFESIEGKRGFPRIKPPFPTTYGVFGKPTVINNVETFANVPLILRDGVEAYRKLGTEDSTGPRLFCLSGDVERPGVYEVTAAITLYELLALAGAKNIKAVLLGGAAGHFVTTEQFDVRLTFEDTRAAGLTLGSGVVMAFDQSRDLRQALVELGHFFAHESCGKCYPCQLGTQRQLEVLHRVAHHQPLPGDVERLTDVGWTMTDASLCGLGQTAASAVLSAIEHWPELFAEELTQ
jgi:NADH-quinone oxidoreductase subunit F